MPAGSRVIGVAAKYTKRSLRLWVLFLLRNLPFRNWRHQLFLRSSIRSPVARDESAAPTRVLVLGVYLADRVNSAAHLVDRFACVDPGVEVEQRWAAIQGPAPSDAVAAVTIWHSDRLAPKFEVINKLLQGADLSSFDYVVVCDDDIYLPHGFLPAFLAYQQSYDLATAQPARAWHSHFDHAFVLRRPWWKVRETRFVECGPLVSFRRDAVRLLMPFEHAEQLWGLDLIWPAILEQHGLKMGIIDAVPVDHSLRPQAATYDKSDKDAAMHRVLATTRHLPMSEAFTVLKGRRKPPAAPSQSTS
jgi:hypothetical protein